jgi:ParB family chromosome partitioning protein
VSEKRRALGRGLGALIPNSPANDRPVDVFFRDRDESSVATMPTPLVAQTGERDTDNSGGGSTTQEPTTGAQPGDSGADTSPGAGDAGGSDSARSVTVKSDDLAPVPGATFAEIALDAIRPNPRQPRTVFDEDDMGELVHSIREIGVLQPIVVRPLPPGSDAEEGITHELIMGERRWRASRAAGKDTVPAIVKATEDDDLLRDALLENLHRSQLNALEEAAAYQQLLDDFGCTQEELASRIGRSRPQVSNTLRLLKLPPLVARRVAAGVLSAGHARALLGLPDAGAMERLAQRVVAEGLSVRSTEEVVALGGDEEKPQRRAPRAGARRPQLDDLAVELSDHLETRVKITLGQRRGKITIDFASVEDLHRIADAMGHKPRQD